MPHQCVGGTHARNIHAEWRLYDAVEVEVSWERSANYGGGHGRRLAAAITDRWKRDARKVLLIGGFGQACGFLQGGEPLGAAQSRPDTQAIYSDLNLSIPSPPLMIAFINEKNRSAYSVGGTGLILCCKWRKRKKHREEHKATHDIVLHPFPVMLELLNKCIRGQNINDAQIVDRPSHRLIVVVCRPETTLVLVEQALLPPLILLGQMERRPIVLPTHRGRAETLRVGRPHRPAHGDSFW